MEIWVDKAGLRRVRFGFREIDVIGTGYHECLADTGW